MTVNTTNSTAEFDTNGATITFPFFFKFLANDDLVVIYVNLLGASTVLTLGTHYTVSGAGNDSGSITTTSVLATGKLIVSREMDAFQPTSLRNQGKFLAETHEDVFDRLTLLIQQGTSWLRRALVRPVGKNFYDAEQCRIVNVADPVNDQDVVNRRWGMALLGQANDYAYSLYLKANAYAEALVAGVVGGYGSFIQVGADAVVRTFQSKMRESVSLADFGGDPTGAALCDSAVAAAKLVSKLVYVPEGTWRISNPLSLPAGVYFFGPGKIVFDRAEWVRRGDPANGREYYTVFYNFTSQSQVHVSIDGVEVPIEGWLTPNTFYVTLGLTTTTLRYWVDNGVCQLGSQPADVVTFSSYGQIPPNVSPGFVGPSPWQYQATDNFGIGVHTLRFLTTGAGNCVVGPRAGTSLTSGANNTLSGFQAGHRTTTGTGNTASGSIALEHNTTGSNNNAFGLNALGSNVTGSGNCAMGVDSAWSFTGGQYNTAMGYRSMANGSNNSQVASQNTALGAFSQDFAGGTSNTSVGYRSLNAEGGTGLYGNDNTAVGAFAARHLRGGGNACTAVGSLALGVETAIGDLTAVGFKSLAANLGGTWNTGCGYSTLAANVTGVGNTALGWSALSLNTGVGNNTALGARSQEVSTSGANNTTSGFEAGRFVTTGSANTLSGTRSGRSITTGNDNVAQGSDSLQFETTGGRNTALGRNALRLLQDGSNQIGVSNSTGIGASAAVSGSNQVQLGDSATTTYVYGTVQNRSDARDKADVRGSSLGLDFIMGLRPVEGRWDLREDYYEDIEVVDASGDVQVERRALPRDGSKVRQRFHQWFLAQEVKALCDSLGVDFGGYQDHSVDGGCDVLSLGYDEFIPPIIKALQDVKLSMDERFTALEERLAVWEGLQQQA